MDYEKQTEGFGGGVGEWDSLVMGSKGARIAWDTGCYTQTVNHGTLHQKLTKIFNRLV